MNKRLITFRLCHQWGFEDLEASVCEYLQAALHVGNVCAILDTALIFGLHSLVITCCMFGDTNAVTLLEHPSFFNLSPVIHMIGGYSILLSHILTISLTFTSNRLA